MRKSTGIILITLAVMFSTLSIIVSITSMYKSNLERDRTNAIFAAKCLEAATFKLSIDDFKELKSQIEKDLLEYDMAIVVKKAYEKMLQLSSVYKSRILSSYLIAAYESFDDPNQMFELLLVAKDGSFNSRKEASELNLMKKEQTDKISEIQENLGK